MLKNEIHSVVKYIIILFFLGCSIVARAQYPYEAFSFGGKTGLVALANLEEVMPPAYRMWDNIELNSRYLIVRPRPDTIIVFDKMTAKPLTGMNVATIYTVTKLAGNIYLHARKGGKSVLLDSLLNERMLLPKTYDECLDREMAAGYFYARKQDSIDVFRLGKEKPERLVSVRGTNLTSAASYNSPDPDKVAYIIYGGPATYLLDRRFKISRKIDSAVSAGYQLYQLINPQKEVYASPYNGEYEETIPPPAPGAFVPLGNITAGRISYASAAGPCKLTMPEDCALRSEDPRHMLVYKSYIVKKNGYTSTMMSDDRSWMFVLDEKNCRALLPVKYQEELGLKVDAK